MIRQNHHGRNILDRQRMQNWVLIPGTVCVKRMALSAGHKSRGMDNGKNRSRYRGRNELEKAFSKNVVIQFFLLRIKSRRIKGKTDDDVLIRWRLLKNVISAAALFFKWLYFSFQTACIFLRGDDSDAYGN